MKPFFVWKMHVLPIQTQSGLFYNWFCLKELVLLIFIPNSILWLVCNNMLMHGICDWKVFLLCFFRLVLTCPVEKRSSKSFRQYDEKGFSNVMLYLSFAIRMYALEETPTLNVNALWYLFKTWKWYKINRYKKLILSGCVLYSSEWVGFVLSFPNLQTIFLCSLSVFINLAIVG